MKARSTLTAFTFFITLTTGCSMAHSDPHNPAKNSHPVKRYEVIATADAPWPWDSVKGYLEYKVSNQECTPEDKFLGVHVMPPMVGHDFEMTRIDEKTWKGYFYRDFLQDGDYYGLGGCKWEPSSVAVAFVAKGVTFSPGSVFEDFLRNISKTEHFKKSDYGDPDSLRYGTLVYSEINPEYLKNKNEFFNITMKVREVAP